MYGHRDFEYQLPGNLRATFLWSPYLSNATSLLNSWYVGAAAPLVCCFTQPAHAGLPPARARTRLWSAPACGTCCTSQTRRTLWRSLQTSGSRPPSLPASSRYVASCLQCTPIQNSWLTPQGLQAASLAIASISHLHPSKLKTEEKRRMMTPQRVNLWNQALQDAGLSTTLSLIDLHHVTQGECLPAAADTTGCVCISSLAGCRLRLGLHRRRPPLQQHNI